MSFMNMFNRYYCPICKNKLNKFISITDHLTQQFKLYSFPYSIDDFETLNHRSYTCPHCESSDRDRLIYKFMNKSISELNSKHGTLSILEFAPSPTLKDAVKKLDDKISYSSADLYMPEADKKVDICHMKESYKDNSFDFIICSHVLEHVEDDFAAMKELRRILRKTGKLIVLVPIIDKDIFDEDISEKDEKERWRKFAQGDHLRLYSKKEFINRLNKANLTVSELNISNLGIKSGTKIGVSNKSTLYVCSK